MVICLEEGADLHMAPVMPLPLTISCSSKSRLVLPSWFYFYDAGLPGSRGQNPESHKTVVVVVVVVSSTPLLRYYHFSSVHDRL